MTSCFRVRTRRKLRSFWKEAGQQGWGAALSEGTGHKTAAAHICVDCSYDTAGLHCKLGKETCRRRKNIMVWYTGL